MARANFHAWAFGAAAVAFAPSAFAAPLLISASEDANGARLSMRYADGRAAPPPATASVQGGVLVVSFDEPLEADVSGLVAGAPKTIAFARVGADGKTLRISLRRTVTPQLAAAAGARLISLAAAAPKPPAPKLVDAAANTAAADAPGKPVDVGVISELNPSTSATDVLLSVGQRPEFTRLSFLFPHGATVVPLLSKRSAAIEILAAGRRRYFRSAHHAAEIPERRAQGLQTRPTLVAAARARAWRAPSAILSMGRASSSICCRRKKRKRRRPRPSWLRPSRRTQSPRLILIRRQNPELFVSPKKKAHRRRRFSTPLGDACARRRLSRG
ncbi:MAG: hypothetical protein WDN76_06025 [Alphaproteobacteria bacterium]